MIDFGKPIIIDWESGLVEAFFDYLTISQFVNNYSTNNRFSKYLDVSFEKRCLIKNNSCIQLPKKKSRWFRSETDYSIFPALNNWILLNPDYSSYQFMKILTEFSIQYECLILPEPFELIICPSEEHKLLILLS